jgi:hypothetical protein
MLFAVTLFQQRQHREQQADHSVIHNLSQKHTPVTSSLQVTPNRAKQHHVSYMVGQQCQTLETRQVDGNRDSAAKVPIYWWQKHGRFRI